MLHVEQPEDTQMSQDINIRFPDTGNGLKALGPFNVGCIYSVPDDVVKHLTAQGFEVVATLKLATKDKPAETVTPLDSRHTEAFAHIRAIDLTRAEAAKAAKSTTAPVDAGAQSGDVK
jgi:hypothetical protein